MRRDTLTVLDLTLLGFRLVIECSASPRRHLLSVTLERTPAGWKGKLGRRWLAWRWRDGGNWEGGR